MKNIGGSVEREAEVLKGIQFLLVPPWDFCLSTLVYEKNRRQMPASYFYTSINRPFAAKPSRDLLFIEVWAATLRMPEMEKACRKHQNGQV